MKKLSALLAVLFLAGFASGCQTYEDTIIDEGTVIEQRMIVE